ncbi:MAG: hypothetical protein AAGC60_09220 [Acidobacteriota bacterium]
MQWNHAQTSMLDLAAPFFGDPPDDPPPGGGKQGIDGEAEESPGSSSSPG